MKFLRSLHEQYKTDYNPSDVLSKLSSGEAAGSDNTPTNSTCFGLEDSRGNIVKVYVKKEQAREFEQALSYEMDADEEGAITDREIAEILYNLHSKYDIVDVKWPTIEEDEEDTPVNQDEFSADMDGPSDPQVGEEMPNDIPASEPVADDASKSALDSVVQAMIADSEAKRQEALAKAAEARAREAEAAAKIAEQKLKAEEEVADMEAYHNSMNDEKKEAKKLAKLALYRHAMKQRDAESGPFDTASAALRNQETSSNERIDQPTGVNPPNTEPSNPQQTNNKDIRSSLDSLGFDENEESTVDGPQTPNRKFKDLQSAVNYLHSMQVRRGGNY
jgi:hypothetical protein